MAPAPSTASTCGLAAWPRNVYGGFLGPTFNAIFEDQMERLMDGDRLYYLYRLDCAAL